MLNPKLLAVLLVGLGVISDVQADVQFNPAFLSGDPSSVADLAAFESNEQLPGTYRIDISLNGQFIETRDVVFVASTSEKDGDGLSPVLSANELIALGVDAQALSEFQSGTTEGMAKPIDIRTLIPGADFVFYFERLRLDLSIPQAAMTKRVVGEVSEDLWDEGINALMLNYMFSGSNSIGEEDIGDDYFVSLNTGFNMGAWRFRNYSTWNKGDETNELQSVSNYLARAIIPLKSELVIGDSSTGSDIFDSVAFRGVQLASDEQMYPSSLQGYAPSVRGIAKSNASVTIKQNGFVIYQTHVPPGPFLIEDLFATSTNGDLDVEVKENDGSTSHYVVPFASIPNLLREGRVKYDVTVGKYRSGSDAQEEPEFIQGSLAMGVQETVTLFGGTQLSSDYQSFAVGIGKNMGNFGAISAELSHANTILPDDTESSGQSLSLLYAKSLVEFGTDLQLLGAHYSTQGYYTFADSTYKSMSGSYEENDDSDQDGSDLDEPINSYDLHYAKRARLEGSISQQIGEAESLYLSARVQNYWDTDEEDKYLQMGYSGVWSDVTYSIAYSHNQSAFEVEEDKVISLNLSFPIGRWLATADDYSSAYADYGVSYDANGQVTNRVGLSGTALDNKNLNYSVQQGYTSKGVGANGNAHVQYQGSKGNVELGYNYSEDNQQITYGGAGGIVVHADGVTFSQPLGNTNILVAAPGAEGAVVENTIGTTTDSDGYAVIPYASSYRFNRVALDVNSLQDDVEIDEAVALVVPTNGALVRAELETKKGGRGLFTLTFNGKPVPFGANVVSENEGVSGIVSEEGIAYLSGLANEGSLAIQWGEGQGQRCAANYQLPEPATQEPIARLALECR
ncbi:fimbrial biogenesis usher protein [Aeromonas sp. sif2416]|uniref:fimbrial biogenesis usher protein n=1 Tax=Aeromonas sp. sif2416 TaxID=2854793 RepID=UPI001C45E8D0|nr:fimbrial biogenesis usher protein [Aeromonas sp. sif2416]MBV7436885.1 fimbrial biogenesis usher protein [Aeromonas sp. sif2416]